MRYGLPIALGIIWIALAMTFLAMADLATKHRTDIKHGGMPTDGRHSVWQLNILDPRNYSAEGTAAYGRLVCVFLLMILAALSFFAVLGRLVFRAI